MTCQEPTRIILENFDLGTAERLLCERALHNTGSIIHAAKMLGITRHSLKRRIVKLGIAWPAPVAGQAASAS